MTRLSDDQLAHMLLGREICSGGHADCLDCGEVVREGECVTLAAHYDTSSGLWFPDGVVCGHCAGSVLFEGADADCDPFAGAVSHSDALLRGRLAVASDQRSQQSFLTLMGDVTVLDRKRVDATA